MFELKGRVHFLGNGHNLQCLQFMHAFLPLALSTFSHPARFSKIDESFSTILSPPPFSFSCQSPSPWLKMSFLFPFLPFSPGFLFNFRLFSKGFAVPGEHYCCGSLFLIFSANNFWSREALYPLLPSSFIE